MARRRKEKAVSPCFFPRKNVSVFLKNSTFSRNTLFRSHAHISCVCASVKKKKESFQNFCDLAFLGDERNGEKRVFTQKYVFFRDFRTLVRSDKIDWNEITYDHLNGISI